MKGGLILLALLAASPAFAKTQSTCQFETLCSGTDPCGPAEDGATIEVLQDGNRATATLDGAPVVLHQAENAEGDPATYFGGEPGEGGGMMLSLFDDGSAALTIHGDLFGPFTATAFGTCEATK